MTVIDELTKERMKRLFDVCFLMAKEGIAFNKYPALLEIQERHGIDIGPAYKSDTSAKLFTSFIAQSQRQCFHEFFSSSVHFF